MLCIVVKKGFTVTRSIRSLAGKSISIKEIKKKHSFRDTMSLLLAALEEKKSCVEGKFMTMDFNAFASIKIEFIS